MASYHELYGIHAETGDLSPCEIDSDCGDECMECKKTVSGVQGRCTRKTENTPCGSGYCSRCMFDVTGVFTCQRQSTQSTWNACTDGSCGECCPERNSCTCLSSCTNNKCTCLYGTCSDGSCKSHDGCCPNQCPAGYLCSAGVCQPTSSSWASTYQSAAGCSPDYNRVCKKQCDGYNCAPVGMWYTAPASECSTGKTGVWRCCNRYTTSDTDPCDTFPQTAYCGSSDRCGDVFTSPYEVPIGTQCPCTAHHYCPAGQYETGGYSCTNACTLPGDTFDGTQGRCKCAEAWDTCDANCMTWWQNEQCNTCPPGSTKCPSKPGDSVPGTPCQCDGAAWECDPLGNCKCAAPVQVPVQPPPPPTLPCLMQCTVQTIDGYRVDSCTSGYYCANGCCQRTGPPGGDPGGGPGDPGGGGNGCFAFLKMGVDAQGTFKPVCPDKTF